MRVLVLSNMRPSAAHPERGRFVRDQVTALRRLASPSAGGEPLTSAAGDEPLTPARGEPLTSSAGDEPLEIELYEFPPGARALAQAARDLHRRYRDQRFDVVHAHFGLSAWPALAVRARARCLTMHGTDLAHSRTRLLTALALRFVDLPVAVSGELLSSIPGARARTRARTIACGVDMERFHPLPRADARARLGLDPEGRYLLFPADPARPEKRHDRALALAQAAGAELLALGGVEPERVPLYVNAAQAVVVPSEREGFGLAALEALACDVAVLATPVGVHPEALQDMPGTLCAPFDLERWREAAAPILAERDPRVAGRGRAERWSTLRMAGQLAQEWRSLVAPHG